MSDAHADEIAKLETLYEENPQGRVFAHLAEAYRKAGDLERAREVLVEGIERHPEYSSAHVVLGRVLRGLDQDAEAESEFLRVLELDNHNLIALRALGDLARDRGDQATALSYYERLVELEPSDEVQEAIAELTSGEPDGPQPEGEHAAVEPDGDPWASVPGSHDRSWSPETEEAEADSEAADDLMDMAEYGAAEDVGDLEEAGWSTEGDADVGEDVYGSWVEDEPEDGAGDGTDGTGAEELALGGGPYESGAPEEERQGDADGSPEDEAGVTTETIAQVYARQGLYDRAADVYRELLRTRPDDETLRDRLAEMEHLAAAQEARPVEEPMAVSDADGDPEGADAIEGFESEEVDLGAASAQPLAGLEVQDADPETGLIVGATPSGMEADPMAGFEEIDGPAPAEAGVAEGEDETLGSVWTGSDWGEAAESETPHAWADEEAEPDDTPPIREYFGGLLSWTGAAGDSGWADEAQEPALHETAEPEQEETGPTEPYGAQSEDEDDDDLDMFRSWLESLKQ